MTSATLADTETTGGAIRPTSEGERIVTLDVLRGLAIFGILFVNIGIFGFPEGYSEIHRELFGGTADRVIHWATQFLIEGKFYSLFSVLFGIGVAIQFDRARQTGRKFGPWYARRLLVLLAIGLVHDVFIVTGIILMTYSIVGFWLIPFLKRRPKTLLRWTVVMILIPVVVVSVFITVRAATEDDGAADSTTVGEANEAEEAAQERDAFDQEVAVFAHGSYLEQVRVRLAKVPESVAVTLGLGTYVLGMFLIGVMLWRSGWITDPLANRARIQKTVVLGLSVGSLCTGGYLVVRAAVTKMPPPEVVIPAVTMQFIGNMALCLGYLGLVVLAMTTRRGRRWLMPMAPVGRTALSNYIFQSMVCATIFYHPGLGLYGTLSPTAGLVARFRHLCGATRPQRLVAPPLPLRPGGVAVALAHLWAEVPDSAGRGEPCDQPVRRRMT